MVDAIREVPRFEGSDLPLPARGVQKRRVLWQFAPPAARHGGELLGPRTEKADQALHAWLRKAAQKNLGQGGRELTVRAIERGPAVDEVNRNVRRLRQREHMIIPICGRCRRDGDLVSSDALGEEAPGPADRRQDFVPWTGAGDGAD